MVFLWFSITRGYTVQYRTWSKGLRSSVSLSPCGWSTSIRYRDALAAGGTSRPLGLRPTSGEMSMSNRLFKGKPEKSWSIVNFSESIFSWEFSSSPQGIAIQFQGFCLEYSDVGESHRTKAPSSGISQFGSDFGSRRSPLVTGAYIVFGLFKASEKIKKQKFQNDFNTM